MNNKVILLAILKSTSLDLGLACPKSRLSDRVSGARLPTKIKTPKSSKLDTDNFLIKCHPHRIVIGTRSEVLLLSPSASYGSFKLRIALMRPLNCEATPI